MTPGRSKRLGVVRSGASAAARFASPLPLWEGLGEGETRDYSPAGSHRSNVGAGSRAVRAFS